MQDLWRCADHPPRIRKGDTARLMPVLQRPLRLAHREAHRTEFGLRTAQPELGPPRALGYRWMFTMETMG